MKICSPQLEKGHTRIANELLEAIIAYPFNATELKIIFVVIRKTYGWKKKTAPISYGHLAKLIGIDKRHVRRSLNKLIHDRIILKERNRTSNILGLNKHYLGWKLWITLKDRGLYTPKVGADTPSGGGLQAPKSEGCQTPTLPSGERKERNIYKENFKERSNYSKFSLLNPKDQNQRRHQKEPVLIKDVIKTII
jgi:phage replication O-like protein O